MNQTEWFDAVEAGKHVQETRYRGRKIKSHIKGRAIARMLNDDERQLCGPQFHAFVLDAESGQVFRVNPEDCDLEASE